MTDAVKNSIIESITIPCRNRCEGHNKNINKNIMIFLSYVVDLPRGLASHYLSESSETSMGIAT